MILNQARSLLKWLYRIKISRAMVWADTAHPLPKCVTKLSPNLTPTTRQGNDVVGKRNITVRPRSLDPIYKLLSIQDVVNVLSYYIKCVTTSWTYIICRRKSWPILYSNLLLLYRMDQEFFDIPYHFLQLRK